MASFTTVWGTRTEINNTPIVNGQMLFEIDREELDIKIYADVSPTTRKELGTYDWASIIKPFNSVGLGLNVSNGVLSDVGMAWGEVKNKPFNTIGSGLSVTNNILNLNTQSWGDIRQRLFNTIGARLSVNDNDGLYVSGQTWAETPNKPFTSLGVGLIIENNILKATGAIVGGLDWSTQIINKPFNTIGSTLTVTDGVLSANASLSSIAWNEVIAKPFDIIGNGLMVYNDILKVDTTVVRTWNDISNKPFNTIGNGLSVDGSKALNVDIITWGDINNKPFNTVNTSSGGLTISSNTISSNIQNVTIDTIGTPSSSTYCYDVIKVNGVATTEVYGTKYMEQTFNLSTSVEASVVFNNTVIDADSVIEVYSDIFGLNLVNLVIEEDRCTVTFPKWSEAINDVKCRIYIK